MEHSSSRRGHSLWIIYSPTFTFEANKYLPVFIITCDKISIVINYFLKKKDDTASLISIEHATVMFHRVQNTSPDIDIFVILFVCTSCNGFYSNFEFANRIKIMYTLAIWCSGTGRFFIDKEIFTGSLPPSHPSQYFHLLREIIWANKQLNTSYW